MTNVFLLIGRRLAGRAGWAGLLVVLLLALPLLGRAQAPAISSFSPSSGVAGSLVTITGTNLNLVKGVRFGIGGLALFTAQSATSLTVRVPVEAASGPIRLTPATGIAVSTASSFTYLVRPAGLTAALSPAGTLEACQARTITGTTTTPAFPTSNVGPAAYGIGGTVQALVMQADGKALVGGDFVFWQTTSVNNLVRINPDGSPDATFVTGSGFNANVKCLALQADGKILVGGAFTGYQGSTAPNLVRLNTDGSIDASFNIGSGFGYTSNNPHHVQQVVVQADGKLLVVGLFDTFNGQPQGNIVRLNTDGSRDATFPVQRTTVNGMNAVAVQDDGKVLLGGRYLEDRGTGNNHVYINRVVRFYPNGTEDTGFNVGGVGFFLDDGYMSNGSRVNSLVVQADGKIVAGGTFTSYNGNTTYNIARLLPNGATDVPFAGSMGGTVLTLALERDGKILIGSVQNANAGPRPGSLTRLNTDGTDNYRFPVTRATSSPNNTWVYAVAVQADDKLLVGGDFTQYQFGTPGQQGVVGQQSLTRLNPDNSINSAPTPVSGATFTFSPGGTTANPLTTTTPGTYSAVATLNGETSAASNAVTLTGCPTPSIISFSPASGEAGTLVTIEGQYLGSIQSVRFGTGGRGTFTMDQSLGTLTVQVPADAASGPLVLTSALGVVLTTNTSFTYTPRIAGLTATLSPAGPLDLCAPRTLTATASTPAFATGTGLNGTVNSVAVYANSYSANKVLVAGDFTTYNGATGQNGLVQLTSDGNLDGYFGTGSGFNVGAGNTVQCVVAASNNMLLVGGKFTSYNGGAFTNLVRLYGSGWSGAGNYDSNFRTGSGFNGMVRSLAVQGDGRVLVGGDFTTYNGSTVNGVTRLNLDGSRDGSFTTGAGVNNILYAVALQDDGKVLIGGAFTSYNGAAVGGLTRLNPDGSRDAAFVTGAGVTVGGTTGVQSLAVQPDGKILVGGSFTSYNGAPQNCLVRLSPDGRRDATFIIGTGFDGAVQSLVVQPDGKILVGGSFTTYNGVAASRVLRLNADGTLDTGFATSSGANASVASLALQPNGLVVAGGSFSSYGGTAANRLARLNPDGGLNTAPTPVVNGITFTMGNANGSNPFFPTRANTYQATAYFNGSFGAYSNTVTVTDCQAPTITAFAPTSGEAGTVVTLTGTTLADVTSVRVNGAAVAFTAASATSLTFTIGAGTTTGTVSLTNAAGTATSGTFTVLTPTISGFSPGTGTAGTLVTVTGTNLDRVRGVRFGTGGLALFTAQSATSLTVRVPVDAASGVLGLTSVAGNLINSTGSFTYTPRPGGLVATLSPAGPLDVCQPRTLTGAVTSPAFATGFNGRVVALAVQADGRVLAGGNFTTYNGTTQNRLVRLLPDGSPDGSFGVGTGFGGNVLSLAVQADGKVLVGGSFSTYKGTAAVRLARLNTDGTLDGTFAVGTGFDSFVRSVVVQPDGKVLVGGDFYTYNGTTASQLVRLNPDGTRDATFSTGSGFGGSVGTLALQADGKVLAGGTFTSYNGTAGPGNLVRLNADGSRDASFGAGTGFDSDVLSLAVQADGRVLVGGSFTSYSGTVAGGIVRLNADGSPDGAFAAGTGFDGLVQRLTLQPNGKILVGGDFGSYNSTTGLKRLVRLNADGTPDATLATGNSFDGGVYASAVQADGKVLAGGAFLNFNGTAAAYLARLTPTGALNTTPTSVSGATLTFSPGGTTANPRVISTPGSYSVVASLNGETSAASNTVVLTACPAPTITSFTPTSGATGTVVTVTGTNLGLASAATINGTAGTITANTATSLTFAVAAGTTTGPVRVTTPGGTATGGTFTADAVTITSFSPTSGVPGTVVTLTGTNLLGATTVAVNGTAASSFTVNSATSITFTVGVGSTPGPVTVTMPGGGTATGGTFTVLLPTASSFSFAPASGPAGTLVTITGTNLDQVRGVRFGTGGLALFTAQSATSLTVRVPVDAASGPLQFTVGAGSNVAGSTSSSTGSFTYTPRPAGLVATLSPTGPLDACQPRTLTGAAASPAFATGTGFDNIPQSLVVQADGKVLAAGAFTSYNGTGQNRLARLNPDGTLDTSFTTGAGFDNNTNALAVQADGKVLVAGYFVSYDGAATGPVVRLNPDGTLDATFAQGGGPRATANAVAVQADGQILAAGLSNATALLERLNPDGSRDATFATVTGFDVNSTLVVQNVVVQADGKVLVGGTFTSYKGSLAGRLIRFNPDGSRDATFATGTGFNGNVTSVVVQADGKVLVGGAFTSYNGTAQSNMTRLNPDGTRDATFTAGFSAGVNTVAVQADGKILAGGPFLTYNGATASHLVRLTTSGTADAGFTTGTGFTGGVRALVVQADGNVVLGGNFSAYQGTTASRLIRLNSDGSINSAPTPVNGATFTFSAGSATTNPLVTSTPGSYSVVASLNGETSAASSAVVLTACGGTPTVTALSAPAELPGMPITLTGTGFTAGSTVSFGGAAATVTYVSPTTLTAVVPATAAPGSSSVQVTTAGVGSVGGPAFTVLAVYDGGTLDACTAAVPATASVGDGAWHYLLASNGQVVAAYNYTGASLGNLSAEVMRANPAAGVRQDAGSRYYLDRNWHLTASAGRFDGRTVGLRFYGLNSEQARLQVADPTATLANLKATQYSGPNEDCQLANNDASGERRTLAAPATSPAGTAWFVAQLAVADHFSEFYLTGSPTPLPVELLSFTAEKRGTTVALAWATASEKNSDRFEVERSRDGRRFERIGQVAAAGSSTSIRRYDFLDRQYPGETNQLYYRLRQVDLDGTFSYSPVRTVTVGSPATLALFPNPTGHGPTHGGAATLTGAVPGTTVRVYDALGREVLAATADASGTAALVLPAGLPTGVYVVHAGSKALRLAVE